MYRLTESHFLFDVTTLRWRPRRHFMQNCATAWWMHTQRLHNIYAAAPARQFLSYSTFVLVWILSELYLTRIENSNKNCYNHVMIKLYTYWWSLAFYGSNSPDDWRRRIGRPRQSWLRTVEADLRPMNLGLATSKRHTQDRSAWRKLVTTATSTTSPWRQREPYSLGNYHR